MDKWSNLSKIIYKRTYARKDNGHLEDWNETVDRVIAGNIKNIDQKFLLPNEIERLKYFMLNRKAMPAGRGLWYSGSPSHAKLGGAANCNCWAVSLDDWENLVLAQDLLMLGGGVGASVEHKFVSKLPKVIKNVSVVNKETKDADFIVPDSREGWVNLTRKVLKSFFVNGESFSYSTICVRGAGESISGFGGIASGPLPLIKFVTKFSQILKNREGTHVRPIDAGDLLCSIGELVVSGNVRRSAIILVGDCFDKDFLRAKRWDLGTLPTERSCANYSVYCDSVEDLHPLFWKTYEAGEPFGIVNKTNIKKYGRMGELKKDTAYLVNPCQPGFAKLLTPTGLTTFNDVKIGNTIWSGNEWTKITNKVSTGIKPVYKYETTHGMFVGTENHSVLENNIKIEVKDAESIDSCVGTSVAQDLTGDLNPQDVIDGLVVGDGTVHKASNNLVYLIIGKNDQDYFNSEIKDLILKDRSQSFKFGAYEINTTINHQELPYTHQRTIPNRFYFGTKEKIRGVLRGLYSANGSVCDNRITLKQSNKKIIQQVQDMLAVLGIRSYYTTNKPTTVVFKNGTYNCKKSYDLNITRDREIFVNLIGFIQSYKNEKIKFVESLRPYINNSHIKSITYLGDFEVFDITVNCDEHTYWTSNCLVSNCGESTLENAEPCCLQEIFLPNLENEEEFIEAAILMHRYGKRVCLENYHHEKINEVIKRNFRIGTSITGCLQSPLFNPATLDKAYEAIQKENLSYSKLLGVPPSIRTTVQKPSGTLGLLGDCTPGIHPAYSRYFIRRVRFASNDPLIPVLKEAGYKTEPVIKFDGSKDYNTLVVDFYCFSGDTTPCADESFDTWRQLDTLLMSQKHWADQAVSVTIYYQKSEIPQIKQWLTENIKNVKSISFLCRDDHDFKQAPLEAINKETYEKLSSKIKPIEWSAINDDQELQESQECEGSCPVK